MNNKAIIKIFYRFLIDNKIFEAFIVNYKEGEIWRQHHNQLGVFKTIPFNCSLQNYLFEHCKLNAEMDFFKNAFLWCTAIKVGESERFKDDFWREWSRDWKIYLNEKKEKLAQLY